MARPFIDSHPQSKPQDDLTSRHLNRWLSAPISAIALRTPVTPNQVSLAVALLAVPMLVAGARGHLLTAVTIWQLMSIMDGVDGEIARAKNLCTNAGAIIDTVLDYVTDTAGAIAVGLALMAQGALGSELVVVLVALAVAARLINDYVSKVVPESRSRMMPASRDTLTLIVFGAAIAAHWLGGWAVVTALGFVTAVRSDSAAFRLLSYRRAERAAQTLPPDIVLPFESSQDSNIT